MLTSTHAMILNAVEVNSVPVNDETLFFVLQNPQNSEIKFLPFSKVITIGNNLLQSTPSGRINSWKVHEDTWVDLYFTDNTLQAEVRQGSKRYTIPAYDIEGIPKEVLAEPKLLTFFLADSWAKLAKTGDDGYKLYLHSRLHGGLSGWGWIVMGALFLGVGGVLVYVATSTATAAVGGGMVVGGFGMAKKGFIQEYKASKEEQKIEAAAHAVRDQKENAGKAEAQRGKDIEVAQGNARATQLREQVKKMEEKLAAKNKENDNLQRRLATHMHSTSPITATASATATTPAPLPSRTTEARDSKTAAPPPLRTVYEGGSDDEKNTPPSPVPESPSNRPR